MKILKESERVMSSDHPRWVGMCLLLILVLLAGCDDGSDSPSDSGTDSDVIEDVKDLSDAGQDIAADVPDEPPSDTAGDGGNAEGGEDILEPPPDTGNGTTETMLQINISEEACCLSVTAGRAVWAESGELMTAVLPGGTAEVLVAHEAIQTDPVLSGDRVVWADDRGGDFDLYVMDLLTGESVVVVSAPGDQLSPSLDGDHLAWVDFRKAPHGPAEAEIYFLDLGDSAAEPIQITNDEAEQDHVFVQGGRMVWSDYVNDPDGIYLNETNPNENNADIMGYDIESGEHFTVVDDPSKQLRPAIEGDAVIWLDWRGIQPEPKYAEFAIYTGNLADDSMEVKVAISSWNYPELWVRPLIHDGVAAWIAEDYGVEGTTRVFLAELGEVPSPPMQMSATNATSIDLREGILSWMDETSLQVMPLEAALEAGELIEGDFR